MVTRVGATRPLVPFVGSCPTCGGPFLGLCVWPVCITLSRRNPRRIGMTRLVDHFKERRYDAPRLDDFVGSSFGRTL
jgi:hypothetical protein